jgi:hypothetical protein
MLLAAIDLLFGLFLLDIVIVSLLTRRTKQRTTAVEAASSQLPTSETSNLSEMASDVSPEKMATSLTNEPPSLKEL